MREFLVRVGQELDDSLAREDELARRVEELEAAPPDPSKLTREQLIEALGAEADAVLEQRARLAQARMAEARTRAEREVRTELDAARARGREIVVEAEAARDRVVAEGESQREQLEATRDRLQAEIAILEQGRDRILDVYRRVRHAVGVVDSDVGSDVDSDVEDANSAVAEPSTEENPAPATAEESEQRAPGTATESPAAPRANDGVHALFTRLESEVTRPRRKPVPRPQPAPVRAEGAPAENAEEAPAVDAPAEATGAEDAPAPVADATSPAVEAPAEAATAEATAAEAAAAEDAGADAEPADPVIVQRDATLAPLATALARQAKRAVQDEQNALLDALRQRRASTDPLAVAPALDDHVAAWREVLRPALDRAYASAYLSEAPAKAPGSQLPEGAPAPLVTDLAHAIVVPLRERVIGALRGASDADALAQRVATRYREWRGQYLEPALMDALAVAYARGVYEGSPEGALLRWVPNAVGQCPDADDNALEPTQRGGNFPTGQQCPPAHPGCRCALAVVDAGADDGGSRAKTDATNA